MISSTQKIKAATKINVFFFLFASAAWLILACSQDDDDNVPDDNDYRQLMRDFVADISYYSKNAHPGFLVIPQNGIELVSKDGTAAGQPDSGYLNAINGNGQEDLLYGYETDDIATPADVTSYLKGFLDISKNAGKTILVTDYCSSRSKVDQSYFINSNSGYISFAADQRNLNTIPGYPLPIINENEETVTSLSRVKNFLYLISFDDFTNKAAVISAVTSTNYDLLITDLFFNDGSAFTSEEIGQMRMKANGGKRLVVSYMSVGEAEDYRYYWQQSWSSSRPAWLDAENPDWPGNYNVKYWMKDWQDIILGNDSSYLARILDAGFDGVYLDIIDAFEYYE